MQNRDILVVILGILAMLVSLNHDGGRTFSFHRAWFHKWSDYGDDILSEELAEHHLLPQPLVVDLNGDGHLEVLLATPDYKLQVVQPQRHGYNGEGFSQAKIITQASLLHRRIASAAEWRPVSMSAGYIDPPPTELVRAPRKQVIVVVTAGGSVLCYDHNLKLMWDRDLSEAEGGPLTAHSHLKEVAVHISPHKMLAQDRGLVVVGLSVARGDLASGEGLQKGGAGRGRGSSQGDVAVGDEDILDAELEAEREEAAHARSAGADEALSDIDAGAPAGTRGLDTSRHFSYLGMEGGAGTQRWHHLSADFHKDLGDLAAEMRPLNDFRLDAEKLEGRHYGQASCRDYRESLLHVLPHSWSGPQDTDLAEAHFVKHRQGRGAHREALATKAAAGQGIRGKPGGPPGHQAHGGSTTSNKGLLGSLSKVKHGQAGIRASPGANLLPAGHGQGGKHSVAHKAAHAVRGGKGGRHAHNVTANVLVAYLEEGIEVIHLFSGRTVCKLHLVPGELHVDLNGDGVLDHVQVYRGAGFHERADASEVAAMIGGRSHHAASHCTVKATSGIPPLHTLFEANICHEGFMARVNDLAGGALFEEHEGLGGWSDDVEVATPVFLPLTHVSAKHGPRFVTHGLIIIMTSRGEITALNGRGQAVWEVVQPVVWPPRNMAGIDAEEAAAAAPQVPTLLALALHTHGQPTAVLAAGASAAVILSEHGHVLDTLWLPAAPSQPMVAGDFSGDGLTDLMAVTPDGLYGWVQVQELGGAALPTVLLVLLLGMLLLIWSNHYVAGGGAGSSGGSKGRRLRSTDVAD